MAVEFNAFLKKSTSRIFASLPVSPSHVVERFGLFTIIVLGESVAGIAGGLIEQDLQSLSTLTAALGLAVVFGIWWLYFENLNGASFRMIRGRGPVIWVYIHLFLAMSITALGVGVEHAVAQGFGHPLEPAVRWLLVGSLASTFATLAIIHFTDARFDELGGYRSKGILRVWIAIAVLIVGFVVMIIDVLPVLLLGLLALLTLGHVISELITPGNTSSEQLSVSGEE